ncbi:hypothetical protein [Methylotuvimicrobium sp.]|uniref:hypothetical protein n=1 Tax=Methylotuvimicrobium sp. TaxID=2822413 RepID=UPI003D64A6C8
MNPAPKLSKIVNHRQWIMEFRCWVNADFAGAKICPAADTCQSSNLTLLSTIRSILKKASYLELYPLVSADFEFKWVSTINTNIAIKNDSSTPLILAA